MPRPEVSRNLSGEVSMGTTTFHSEVSHGHKSYQAGGFPPAQDLPSTVDRRIERGELNVEKEVHGSRNRIWVVLEDADLDVPGEVPGKVSPENLP